MIKYLRAGCKTVQNSTAKNGGEIVLLYVGGVMCSASSVQSCSRLMWWCTARPTSRHSASHSSDQSIRHCIFQPPQPQHRAAVLLLVWRYITPARPSHEAILTASSLMDCSLSLDAHSRVEWGRRRREREKKKVVQEWKK